MKKDDKQSVEGLNQLLEIINAKGDEGEVKEIVQKTNQEEIIEDEIEEY